MAAKKILLLVFLILVYSGIALAAPNIIVQNINPFPNPVCAGQDQVIYFELFNNGDQAASISVDVNIGGTYYTTIPAVTVGVGQSVKRIVALPINDMSMIVFTPDYGSLKVHVPTVDSSCPNTFTDSTLRRFYKTSITDHFYTIDSWHANNAIANGYYEETNQGQVSSTWFSGSLPLYRFWKQATETHYYTTSESNLINFVNNGWEFEGIEGYLYSSQVSGTTPLYHAYYAGGTDNLYTIDSSERQTVLSWGYSDQGIVGYVKGSDTPLPPPTLPAPKLALFSDSNPVAGDTLAYTYQIEASQMDNNYKTMVHFIDDSESIIINDDHWLSEMKGFNTDSSSFDGLITYQRSISIPPSFSGRLRMIVGFYDIANPSVRIELDPQYVTDLGFERYLVAEVQAQPLPVGGPDQFIQDIVDSFPALFHYDDAKNGNLALAFYYISESLKLQGVVITKELLASIMATLEKEVPSEFAPIEEGGDFGMGPGCTYKVDGACRSDPYNGGVDYKGRGYIQVTHRYNYQNYCGEECVGSSEASLDICGCKNKWHCDVTDVDICPQLKALQPELAGRIFALYYIGRNLVVESNNENYWTVGKIINGGDSYANSFQQIAINYLSLFNSNSADTNYLLSLLNGDYLSYEEGKWYKETGDNKVYLFKNGEFSHIADETAFCHNIYANLTLLSRFIELSDGEIASWDSYGEQLVAPGSYYTYPLPPSEGSLVKDACSDKVYLYENGEYRWIFNEYTFESLGFDFNEVITLAYNRIAQQNNYGEPIKLEPSCQLPAKHKVSFTNLDSYDTNWEKVVIGGDVLLSNPLENIIPYNPQTTSCTDFKVCNHYRGDYNHNAEGSGSHSGIDVLAPAYTTKVYAFAKGVLVEDVVPTIRQILTASTSSNGGYGGMVIIRHDGITLDGKPLYSTYAHLREFNPNLVVGSYVEAGEYLGLLANDMSSADPVGAGYSTDPHLHFQLDKEPNSQTPVWPYMASGVTGTNTDDQGVLNMYTVNPLKILNRFGYYLPSELEQYYACGEQAAVGGPDAATIENIAVFYSTDSAVITWEDTPAPTYQIAMAKESDFSDVMTLLASAPLHEIQLDGTPTYAKIKSSNSDWSPVITIDENNPGTPDCISTTDLIITEPLTIKLCPGVYYDTITINSDNVFLDLTGVTIQNTDTAIQLNSGYGFDTLKQDLEGVKPEHLTQENINQYIATLPALENITIINGNFQDVSTGINLSAVSNLKIINNTFNNVENPIFTITFDSEVSDNTVSYAGETSGTGISVIGVDNIVSSNLVQGKYETGLLVGGFNIAAESNTVEESKKGAMLVGKWNKFINNYLTDNKETLIGFVALESNITNNDINNNQKGIHIVCSDGLNIGNNVFSESSKEAIKFSNFFGGDCNSNNNIMNNFFVLQNNPSIKFLKQDVDGDTFIDTNEFKNNIYCNTESECEEELALLQRFDNPALWQHEYNIVYTPGEMRSISNVELISNFLTDWDNRPMQLIDGKYYIGFDNLNQGERIFNIKYNVDGVNMDYYAITSQGMAGEVYINGELLSCDYTYYFPPYSANYKVVVEGSGEFSNPGSADRLPGCEQLCSEDKLSQRVSWTAAGELDIPGAVFTGNCYVNGSLQFDCPIMGKNNLVSGAFDVWANNIPFTAQQDNSGTTGLMKDTYIASQPWRQEEGVTIFYSEAGLDYWLDNNHCHPDVVLEGSAHHIKPPE